MGSSSQPTWARVSARMSTLSPGRHVDGARAMLASCIHEASWCHNMRMRAHSSACTCTRMLRSICGPSPEPQNSMNGDWLDRAQWIAQQSTCMESPSNGAFNMMQHHTIWAFSQRPSLRAESSSPTELRAPLGSWARTRVQQLSGETRTHCRPQVYDIVVYYVIVCDSIVCHHLTIVWYQYIMLVVLYCTVRSKSRDGEGLACREETLDRTGPKARLRTVSRNSFLESIPGRDYSPGAYSWMGILSWRVSPIHHDTMCVYIYIYIYICTHICICIHVYIYIYIYI